MIEKIPKFTMPDNSLCRKWPEMLQYLIDATPEVITIFHRDSEPEQSTLGLKLLQIYTECLRLDTALVSLVETQLEESEEYDEAAGILNRISISAAAVSKNRTQYERRQRRKK